jgi:thiol-disulfide isomerase/thioredoxin
MRQTANGTRMRTLVVAGLVLLAVVAGAVALIAPQVFNISQGVASREGPACTDAPAAMGRVLPAPAGGEPVPDTLLTAEGGKTVGLHALLAGRAGAVVNLWATWCAPCVREMPDLDRLHGILAPHGINVVALSEDRTAPDAPRQFFDANGIRNLDVLIDPKGTFAREVSIRGLPTTLLIDAQGVERARVEGVADWPADDAVAFIRGCLVPGSGAAPAPVPAPASARN